MNNSVFAKSLLTAGAILTVLAAVDIAVSRTAGDGDRVGPDRLPVR